MHQRHVAVYARLLPLGANPVAVAFTNDVLHPQVLEVDVCKAGETSKDKYCARRVEIARGHRCNHNALQFFLVQDFAIDRVDADFESHEGIARCDVARPGHPKHGLQGLDVLHGGVVPATSLGAHVHFEVFQEDKAELIETDVVALIVLLQIIEQVRAAARILLNSSLCIALALEQRLTLDDHVEHFKECWVTGFAHRVFACEAVFNMHHTRGAPAEHHVLL